MTGDWSFKRHCHAALRFGLLAAAIFFINWGIVDLFGTVPAITTLGCDSNVIQLPFAYSRWLDVPFALLYITIFWALHYALIVNTDKSDYYSRKNTQDSLVCGSLMGLFFGAMTAITIGLMPLSVIIVPVIMAFLILAALPFLEEGGTFVLAIGFVSGGFASAVAGVGIGLTVALGEMLIASAIVGVVIALKWLIIGFPTEIGFWRKVWDLLTAAGINGE